MCLTRKAERDRKWGRYPELAALYADMPTPDSWDRLFSTDYTPADAAREFQHVISVVGGNREQLLALIEACPSTYERDITELVDGCKRHALYYESEAQRLEAIATELRDLLR